MNLKARISRVLSTIPSDLKSKLAWTLGILVVYFIFLNLPIIGVLAYGPFDPCGRSIEEACDPLLLYRVITASERGSLAELGVLPIILSVVILQILIGLRIIKVDFTKKDDRKLYALTSKVLAIILTIAFALIFSLSGIYGEDIPYYLKIAIFIQILVVGILIILMDELIQRGYGLGSGTSLFILASVCYNIFKGMLSLNQEVIAGDTWYKGSFLAFFQGISRGNILPTFYSPYRTYDLLDFFVLLIASVIIIFFILIKIEIPAQSKKDESPSRYPIWSLHTFYVPVILSSGFLAIIGFVYNLVSKSEPQGFFGIFFPPKDPGMIVQQPALVIGYIIVMTLSCGFFSRIWYTTASMDSLSIAKQFLSKDFIIPGFREHPKTVQKYIERYVQTAAWLGGFLMGFLASIADFLGPLGTGTGVLVALCILREYYIIMIGKK